jgi:phosphomethylpyrimidine synthase
VQLWLRGVRLQPLQPDPGNAGEGKWLLQIKPAAVLSFEGITVFLCNAGRIEMEYSTQMQAARKGLVTRQMLDVLADESITEDHLLAGISSGQIVIPANHNHRNLKGIGIGSGLRTKVNVNLGVSEDCNNLSMEMKKVEAALEMKTDAIMDLSTCGDIQDFRRKVIANSSVMIGTVPIYEAAIRYNKAIDMISVDELFDVVENHAENGVDFITIHAGLTATAVERLKRTPRLTHVVSRGGAILLEWMEKNEAENPYYANFDRLLDICKKYDVTISLGDGLRPGCLEDATDSAQITELVFLGELTKVAWEEDVQVMIEGPGHVPLNEVIANMQLEKKLCHGAPFYVLGPVVTDVAPGYDHITAAIGGALAAANGADFLCYVTPAEHLRLPDIEDMRDGIIATRIAAHAADIAKGIPNAIEWDKSISKARVELDWEKMIRLAMDPKRAKEYRDSAKLLDPEVCSMCGTLCSLRRSRKILEGSGKKE